jgi:hypothetical protein
MKDGVIWVNRVRYEMRPECFSDDHLQRFPFFAGPLSEEIVLTLGYYSLDERHRL